MLIRIVRMTFKEDKIEAFLQNFHETKQQIRNFEGCRHLELLQDALQRNVYYTYSHWESENHLHNYRNSAFFKEVWAFTKTLFSEKPAAFSVYKVESL